jgi:hypothetical protein
MHYNLKTRKALMQSIKGRQARYAAGADELVDI